MADPAHLSHLGVAKLGEDGKPMGPMFHRVAIVMKKEKDGSWKIAAARPGLPIW